MSSEPFSLLDSAWLPVLRRSGARELIRPAEITSRIVEDPVVAFDWRRADFDAAAHELLIGLLSTACWQRVADGDAWQEWWASPPDPAELDAAFAPFRDAFVLDGLGPRFMQDRAELGGASVPIGGLLIDEPGEQTRKKNTDLFVKRGRASAFGRPAAAMALFTLQAHAPAGGAGNRTSLRGGGPMTTIVLPGERDAPLPLWHTLWLNTYWDEDWPEPREDELSRIFPWLAPTRTSEGDRSTTPKDNGVHPAQFFWGMPRRIRLDVTAAPESQPCDLTGQEDSVLVTGFRQRPWGISYVGWQHPLTPYYKTKSSDAEWLPLHPQPERLGYRHWIGIVLDDDPDKQLRRRALVISAAEKRLGDLPTSDRGPTRSRLWAGGYDMDNMKARGFVESELPLYLVRPEHRENFDPTVRELVTKARDTASLLGGTVRQALWGNEAPSSDAGDRYLASERFWARTEAAFLDVVGRLAGALGQAADEAGVRAALSAATAEWREELSRHALAIFDELVPLDTLEEQRAMERRVAARRRLFWTLQAKQPATGPKPKRGRKTA